MNNLLISLLPLLGVVLGAALQYWFGKATQREGQFELLRYQAYADYLRAVAAAGHLRSDEDLRNAHRDAADAKSRIAIYGTPGVISALARFEKTGANLADEHSAKTFVTLVTEMRPNAGIDEADVQLALFGPRDW